MSDDTRTSSVGPDDEVRTVGGYRVDRLLVALHSPRRMILFVAVGAVGAVCDMTVLLVLVEVVGILEELALLVGMETAILTMFLLNERFTFDAAGAMGGKSFLSRLKRSHFVRAGGFFVQFVVFVIIYRLLYTPIAINGVEGWLLVSKVGGIVAGVTVNYTFESLFTWKVHHDD